MRNGICRASHGEGDDGRLDRQRLRQTHTVCGVSGGSQLVLGNGVANTRRVALGIRHIGGRHSLVESGQRASLHVLALTVGGGCGGHRLELVRAAHAQQCALTVRGGSRRNSLVLGRRRANTEGSAGAVTGACGRGSLVLCLRGTRGEIGTHPV